VLDALATITAIVPAIWHCEVANALLVGERRGRSTSADTDTWTTFLGGLPIMVDTETQGRAWPDTLALARAYQLSHYDASYLELALRLRLPLGTLDAKLKQAAQASDVPEFVPTNP
jgi:predicted nucleic acid-binding protein